MLKKTITYSDLDGNSVTEDFYFNLSKAEIAEMELSHPGGFGKYLEELIASQDGGKIISTFKQIIMDAIGRRSEDGKRFVKSPEITKEFLETDAYSELFMELVLNAEAAAEFVAGIVPQDMAESIAKGEGITNVPLPGPKVPAYIRENRDPTKAELMEMSKEEIQEAFKRRNLRSVD